MAERFDTLAAFLAHGYDDVIDVRSPSEFAEDHVPGAISLPVLDNDERAKVGTLYKTDAFAAKITGAALVARNAAAHLEASLADKPGGWRPLVYCWRGGQRSGSFATILQQIGWRADVIEGGYRAYRRLVAEAMYDAPLPHSLIVLEGHTGTAKTDILKCLQVRGTQMLDLEGLANHRGSVFGAMQGGQPSQKAFEGALAAAMLALDPARPVVVEAESSKIGNLLIPPTIWKAMLVAPRIRVTAPLQARARYLATAYADIVGDGAVLGRILETLVQFQGKERVAHWHELAGDGAFETLACELMEHHYDPRYAKSGERNDAARLGEVVSDTLTPEALDRVAGEVAGLVDGAVAAK
ncbi:MAG: tRNA 2-selenouridine(34) synthase MnmH [Marinosulfonomonas sp.]|nr:tRNA 2-selenouridine(34) synthase MnmH [Marinosulfonomonas sp.]